MLERTTLRIQNRNSVRKSNSEPRIKIMKKKKKRKRERNKE